MVIHKNFFKILMNLLNKKKKKNKELIYLFKKITFIWDKEIIIFVFKKKNKNRLQMLIV